MDSESSHNVILTKELLQDVIRWDIPNWCKALPFWEKNAELKPGMKALGIGEREGGLSLWLALKGLNVTCTEYTEFPNETFELHKKYNIQHLVTYQREDATALSFPNESFDVVVLKSVLGALVTKERQQLAIDEIYRVLKPDGVILFAENTAATHFHRIIRKKFARWAEYWRYFSLKNNDIALFSKFETKAISTTGFWGFMAKGKLTAIMQFCEIISSPFIPSNWHYIFFAIFKKPTTN